MKALILGANGQLGYELRKSCPEGCEAEVCDYPQVDFTTIDTVAKCIEKTAPQIIINAAAYTAVDKAEEEKALAYQINAHAPRALAEFALNSGIKLIHISTDFVFDGCHHRPYRPIDPVNPVSVYGASKLEGEKAICEILGKDSLIIRTAWLYSAHGNNFVKTMLKLMLVKKRLTVIDEQIGTPTWANGLANVIWKSAEENVTGLFHWTDAGVASWYDFAVAIQEEALGMGLLTKPIPIIPVGVDAYPTPAKRPWYSVLDTRDIAGRLGITPVHWRVQLREMLKELRTED